MDAESPQISSGPPNLEFLLCGSPNDAFYSQIAFFRLSLDQLGIPQCAARVVAVFGAEEYPPLPARWARQFERVEVHYASPAEFRRTRYFAASDRRYRLVTPGCPCSVLCDADTVLVRPLPDAFLDDLRKQPAVCGVIAHYPFPIEVDTRSRGTEDELYPGMPHDLAWERIGRAIIGHAPERPLRYTLTEGMEDDCCPFYVNYGFLAGPADQLTRLADELERVQPQLDALMGGYYVGQIGIALAVERAGIPWRALPLRFNFPNDRGADARYPEELQQAVLLHYLRDSSFDRHRVFASREAFDAFLTLDLKGSDRAFRDRVLEVTSGSYPFGQAARSPSMICVLGMHRAGTSATTGALSRLGVHLGPPEHLMLANEDNPAGFFEHQALTDLNDEILRRLGGSWHEPPVMSGGWQRDPGLDDLRDRAAHLLREHFGSLASWGWKDPRTCLTLPFWQPLLPSPRYVLCLRSPLDVAYSLQARDGFSLRKGVALWMQHMTSAVRNLGSASVLLMAYDDLVERTEFEVGRLEAYVGAGVSGAAAREAAVQALTSRLRHHRAAPAELFEPDAAWYDASAFYLFLRSLADLQRDEGSGPGAPATFGEWMVLYIQRAREGREARRGLADSERMLEATQADAARSTTELRAAIGDLERARAAQADLLQYLQARTGASKAILRAWLPAPVHRALRRLGLRVFPGLARNSSRGS